MTWILFSAAALAASARLILWSATFWPAVQPEKGGTNAFLFRQNRVQYNRRKQVNP